MQIKWLIFPVVLTALFLQGCETVKGAGRGFSKDVQNTYHLMTDEDSDLKKADSWVQDKLW